MPDAEAIFRAAFEAGWGAHAAQNIYPFATEVDEAWADYARDNGLNQGTDR